MAKDWHFWSFLAKYLSLWSIVVLCLTKKNGNGVPRWFSDMWVPELLLPPKIIRMFGPKTAIFAPKYAFLGTKRPCRFIWCPVGWWLWRASCISQDAYSLYDIPYICICCEAVKLTGLGRNKELRGLKGGRVSGGL